MDAHRKITRFYELQMAAAALLYLGVLYARHALVAAAPGGALQAAAMLLPILPVWLMLAAVIRFYFRVDEYQRLAILQSAALAAGVSACLFSSYPFAADAFHLPEVSIMWAWPVFGVLWGAVSVWNQWCRPA